MLQIAGVDESTAIADPNVQHMLPAFTQLWNQDLVQVWEVEEATFTFVPMSKTRLCNSTLASRIREPDWRLPGAQTLLPGPMTRSSPQPPSG